MPEVITARVPSPAFQEEGCGGKKDFNPHPSKKDTEAEGITVGYLPE
jgi:hypothetical protein